MGIVHLYRVESYCKIYFHYNFMNLNLILIYTLFEYFENINLKVLCNIILHLNRFIVILHEILQVKKKIVWKISKWLANRIP